MKFYEAISKFKAIFFLCSKYTNYHASIQNYDFVDDNSEWYIDLKNGAGSYGKGQPASAADVTFTLKSADFGKMFSGKLKPTTAFMTGKLKIAGNMGKAMSLEKLMGKMQKRSFSTSIQPRE